MKPFRFRQFSVVQSPAVFRVGTDAVLLGSLASIRGGEVLEVGCGTGLISLMIAQRHSEANITTIDINAEAAALSATNFAASPFAARLKAVHGDFKDFKAEQLFDQIICNPPYFEPNSSQKDIIARQRTELGFSQLMERSSELLCAEGMLSVIIPAAETQAFVSESKMHGLHLIRKIDIFGIEGGLLKRTILEFSPVWRELFSERFTIEKSPRQYSDQYLECTKAFHIFNK